MKALKKIWRLFVDDARLAIAVPLWCLLCAVAAPHLPPAVGAALLFIGLAGALFASVAAAGTTIAGRNAAQGPHTPAIAERIHADL
jgi:hypothetical protein